MLSNGRSGNCRRRITPVSARRWSVRILCGVLSLILTLGLTIGWGIAQEEPEKPELQPWQLRGILAALDDKDPLVWAEALNKLAEFELETLQPELEISQETFKQIVRLFEDEKTPVEPRAAAARALGSMGERAADQAPKLVEVVIDADADSDIRYAATDALGNMGEAAADQAPKLGEVVIDADVESDIRAAATNALGSMGEAAADQAPKLSELVVDSNTDLDIRYVAADALGKIGEAAAEQAPKLFEFVIDSNTDRDIRYAAAVALGNMGESAAEQAPKLSELVIDTNADRHIRLAAAVALRNMGEAAADQAPKLIEVFIAPNADSNIRAAAAIALGSMGESAAEQAPKLGEVFIDSNADSDIRYAAAIALGNMGEAAADQAPKLSELVIDTNANRDIRFATAIALGNMGEAAAEQAPKLSELVIDTDADRDIRFAAAFALGGMGEALVDLAPKLFDVIADSSIDSDIRSAVAHALGTKREVAAGQASQISALLQEQKRVKSYYQLFRYYDQDLSKFTGREASLHAADALSQIGPVDDPEVVNEIMLQALNAVNLNQPIASKFRFLAYFLSNADEDALVLIQWLGVRDEAYAPDPNRLSHNEAVRVLTAFAKAWPSDNELPRKIRAEWPRHIANIVEAGSWQVDDLPLLRRHLSNLRAIRSTQAASVHDVIISLEWWRGIWIGRDIWIGHALFWLLLVFFYPKFPQIQAIFFWNPWVRRITGLGYVGFAISWVPFLRARLFAPFQESLLANAGLDGFSPDVYFPESDVENKATGVKRPLQTAIPAIKGQIILEGESGLGKTMFLRHLILRSLQQPSKKTVWNKLRDVIQPTPIIVFLPADRCAEGVEKAIQAKLHGLAKDPAFLRNLIYSGAIDICIDGLNEVTADTRSTITRFVENYFKGNIIMTTQPLEWRPPATATTYVLQPLKRRQVEDFLDTRQLMLPHDAPIQDEAYTQACKKFLQEALNPHQPREELTAARRILSNPMDLTLVTQMIASGEPPNLFRLQEQQYKLMADDYHRLHLESFQLDWFSECVYDMRLHDRTAIPEADFYDELRCMERHKMVTLRQGVDSQGEPTKEWHFRHDKIMEFFIVQTFIGDQNDRPNKHLGDPRFRGVYFLLAKLMPLKDALALREELIQYAADTRDHTVSDDFVQLLRSRQSAA
ncbi:MAG: HEAT repeat domain-containing protein [Elainellaceae cyanobacterium]